MSPALFLVVFLLYVLTMIGLSIWISRWQTSGEDFLLGNRSIPLLLVLGSTVATMVGTGSSIGAVGQGYSHGWRGAMFGVGGGLGMLLLAKLFAGVRSYNFMTMSEEISFYYGANRWIKGLVAISMLLASIGWLGAHILGGSYYLEYVGKIDPVVAKAILAFGFGTYVVIGGYVAVVWTDTIQAIVLFAGFILMALFAVYQIGGPAEVSNLENGSFEFLNGAQLLPSVSLAVAIMVGILGTPSYRQRIYSADSPVTVKKSFYLSGFLYLMFCFLPALIGICVNQLNPQLENHDHAFLYMANDLMPAAVGMVVLIAGLSATMSSASSDAIAAVAILFRDVYEMFMGKMPDNRQMVRNSRWGLVAIMIAAFAITLPAQDIIRYIKDMISFIMSGLVVCTLMGKYWQRATWQGGIAAILGGGICTVLFKFTPSLEAYWGGPIIPSLICASVAGFLVSLITPVNTVTDAEALTTLATERRKMEMHDEV
ncbi:sodium:proline symporter [Blastopirellula marina]|uniref:Sodium:proline symporter n=1 Tax=Blastopirellula marina TaxID=124 RepID=A0A2S8F2K6_9BACT|nr:MULTISPECIES: sodium:solute symporter family protein [Pirellulaceae]PQO26379.1 sodium:proline symporter [Blastopirellula marina]RCS44835.1 sodium:solute symporter family protein [Bremerella cremea]